MAKNKFSTTAKLYVPAYSLFRILDLTHCFPGAGPMQAPGLFDVADKRGKFGLVHNIGLGGAVVVSLLRRPEFYKEGGRDGRDRYGAPSSRFQLH